MAASLIIGLVIVTGSLVVGLWRLNRPPKVGDTPVGVYLRRAAECGHPRPVRPYTATQAHQVMRDLRDCSALACPAKGLAYRVLVERGEIQPDVRMDWMVGR